MGSTLLSINETLLFTNRISIESFSCWMLNIGMGEIWKWSGWFFSFIVNEPLLIRCNLWVLPNSRSSHLRLAPLQCLKQYNVKQYVIDLPVLQQWSLPQTPISRGEPHGIHRAGLGCQLSSSSWIKMAESHKEGSGEEVWVILLNIMTRKCWNTKELVTA